MPLRLSPATLRDFLAARLALRDDALWRVMGLLRPYRGRVALANALIGLSNALMAVSIISLLPMFEFALSQVRPDQQPTTAAAPAVPGAPRSGTLATTATLQAAASRTSTTTATVAAAPTGRHHRKAGPGLGTGLPRSANFLSHFENKRWAAPVVTWAKQSTTRYLLLYSSLIIMLMLVKGLAQYLGQMLMDRVAIEVSGDMMRRVYGNVLRQELEFFDHTPTGTILNSCYREVFNLQQLVTTLASTRIITPITMVILFGSLVYISLGLALMLLLLLPLVILPTLTVTRRLRRSLNDEIGEESLVMDHMTEGLHGILAIKAFGAEKFEASIIDPSVDSYVKSTRARRRAQAAVGPLVDFLNMLVMLVLFVVVLVFFVNRLALSGAELMGFLMMITRFYRPMTTLLNMNVQMQRSRALARRIFALLDRQPVIGDVAQPRPFPRQWAAIEMRGISLRYRVQRRRRPMRLRDAVLDANLTLQRGDAMAIIGPNGAGKSSIVKLLCRLYEPSEGEILVGGVPLRDLALEDLRREFVLVTQHPVLFNRSVRENILFGAEEPHPGAVEAAARAVGAEDFILRMPNGYDSEIGEGGRLLSGGERQKVALARALVRQPSLLILDEPTTGLDQATVEDFLATVRRLNEQGVTIVYITHDHGHLQPFGRIVEFTVDHHLRERAPQPSGTA